MKNIYPLALSLLLAACNLTAYSKPLTPQEALSRIEQYGSGRKLRANTGDFSLKFTLNDQSNEPTLYVFNKEGGKGFVIASADDSAFPILGYSDECTFDSSNIPSGLSYWLNGYSREIAEARENNITETAESVTNPLAGMAAISPLLKSKWNQGAPYNKYCYEISSDGTQTQSVTGCVATSMAQVMYYFKQPAVGTGEISYKHGDSGTYEMDFGAQKFSWSEMLPTYLPGTYTEEEAEAVAYLMKACGYSVKMDYGKGESGASGTAIAGALIDYFGYNKNIEVQTRAWFTYNDWITMIYDNLKNVGPVVYNGSALDGGHSFVCDGYDGNGYFHINWGWGGMSDGYYLLDALNPDEFGIGGAAGGYNLGQQVILNISPETGEQIHPQLMQFGNAKGEIKEGKLTLSLDDSDSPGFQYINPTPVTLTLGLKMVNATDPSQAVQYFESEKKNLEAKQGTRFNWDKDGTSVDLAKVEMTEGDEYNFIFATDITVSDTTEWNEVVAMPGKYNYVTVKKTADGYELVTNTVGNIEVSNFQIVSNPVYWNMPVQFSADFTNSSESQLTRNYSAVFFDSEGKECYKMENYSINVDGNSAITDDTWTSVNWYKEDGAGDVTEDTQFTVKLYDNWQGEYVDGIAQTVTVQPKAPEAKVESTLSILNGEKKGDIYIINGDKIEVSLNVKVTEGVFNHTIMFALQEPMTNGDYITIMHKHFDAIPNLTAGEEETYDMTVQFDDLDSDKTYRVEVWGPDGGFNEKVLVKFNLSADGIQSIVPDTDGRYTIYSVDGTCRGTFNNLDILPSLPKSVYIVNGSKILN